MAVKKRWKGYQKVSVPKIPPSKAEREEMALETKIVPRFGEGWAQFNAFEQFLLLGPDRDIPMLAKNSNVHPTTLRHWCKKFRWHERCRIIDEKCMEKLQSTHVDKLHEEVVKRHLSTYQKIQERAMEHLEKKNGEGMVQFENARDAALSADVAIRGERAVLGLDQKKVNEALDAKGFASLVRMVSQGAAIPGKVVDADVVDNSG